MADPINDDQQNQTVLNAGTENNTEKSFADQVSDTVKLFKDDGTGKQVLPKDLEISEGLRYSAMAEKRRRDTESTLGKTRAQLNASQATQDAYKKRMVGQPAAITAERRAELDDLKITDPEAWRLELNKMDQQANSALDTELSDISSEAVQAAEVTRREDVLLQFNAEHSDAPINDASLQNEIPPRITKRLSDGTISFEEFLNEAYEYLVAPKTTVGATATADPSLGAAGGTSNPSNEAQAAADITDYANTVF